MAPSSTPVIREPIASASADGAPFFSCSFSMSGAITVAKPSALAWIQPGRSTTRTGAVVRRRPAR